MRQCERRKAGGRVKESKRERKRARESGRGHNGNVMNLREFRGNGFGKTERNTI